MLNSVTKKKIETLLNKFAERASCLDITELEGFLYALVITPEIIPPSEWMPLIFDDETPECDTKELQLLVTECIHAYNQYNTLLLKGNLHFPYDPKTFQTDLTDDLINSLWGWNFGFWQGLQLRLEFWNSGIFAKKMKLDKDPIIEILKVIEFISDIDYKDSAFFNDILRDKPVELSEDDFYTLTINDFLIMLPEMVSLIQKFAAIIKKQNKAQTLNQAPVHSEKIGRNDPCPCESGKKYKKCCGLLQA